MKSPKPVCETWFVTRKISEDLYCINEAHYWEWNRANLWLIKGEKQDLLIDTGLGVASLRQYIAGLIDKPHSRDLFSRSRAIVREDCMSSIELPFIQPKQKR